MRKSVESLIKSKAERRLRVGIFGIGKSNLGVIDYLKRREIDFALTVRSDTPISECKIPFTERILTGDRAYLDINEDILFLSPSVKRERRELSCAMARGVLISSDAELFFEYANGEIYAVTGSDGKSTTTYLIAAALKDAGFDAIPAGNFGISLSSLIDSGKIAVAELSSFQLKYLLPRSKRAVITSVSKNHLNWHSDFSDYLRAKKNITYLSGGTVVDFDSEWARSLVSERIPFAAASTKLCYDDIRKNIDAEHYLTRSGGTVLLDGKEYFSVSNAIRTEEYNIKNYMLAAGALIGTSSEGQIEKTVCSFRGLSHRAERICVRDGITYVDSSIDSTPERTLRTLRELRGDIGVIIGGRGKGLSLDALAEELPRLSSAAALLGEVGEELYSLLKKRAPNFPIKAASDFQSAIEFLKTTLKNGGYIILSPAATSFDKYRSFEERGEDFKRAVLED